jgi:hypothetical protein
MNRTYNLCYGKYLKFYYDEVEIIAVKAPSFIRKIDCNAIVDELYKTNISDDKEEDKYIKKIIGNINFGLLEKSWNKKVKSHVFNTIEECKFYQIKYGGSISVIEEYKDVACEKASVFNALDRNIEGVETDNNKTYTEIKRVSTGKEIICIEYFRPDQSIKWF